MNRHLLRLFTNFGFVYTTAIIAIIAFCVLVALLLSLLI
jgi:hypothetical protein